MGSIKSKILTSIISFCIIIAAFPAMTLNAATNWSYDDSTKTLTVSYSGAIPSFKNSMYAPWEQYSTDAEKIVLENGITSVGNYAFNSFVAVKEIVWPTTGKLTTIGTGAFFSCKSLEKVELPEGITTLGQNAFADCYALTSIKLPNSLKSIGVGAFSSEASSAVTSITIPSKVTTIGNYAFNNQKNIKSVTGGAGLVTIGSYAFNKCTNLATFKSTSKNLKTIGKCAFSGTKVTTLYIQNTTKLTKKTVKLSLYGSKIKTVKVKKSKVSTYKKYFVKKNSGRKVTVKK